MYIKHNSLGDDIPIVVVLKAMGLECDEEIVQLVGTESEILDLFSGSLEEPYYLGIYSQDQVSDVRQKIGQMSRKCISHFIVKINNLNEFCNEVANRYNEKQ